MAKAPYYLRAVIDAHTLAKPEISQSMAEELERDGLIEQTPMGNWTTTGRGAAYVELLREVPLPVQKWVDPRGKA